MKFMLNTGNWSPNWEVWKKSVPEAEALGFTAFIAPDHYMWGPAQGGDSTIDTWIALSYLAAKTDKIMLGTLVTPIPFRPPGMLAKEIATLDYISGGRAILGVGSGWSQTEFEGYSEWNEPKVRVDKTEEGLELILKLWTTNGKVNFDGKYYKAKDAVLEPKPIQKPHPLLLFGGGHKRMFQMAGKYADICVIRLSGGYTTNEVKDVVLESARKYSREDKITFSPFPWRFANNKYSRQEIEKEVANGAKDGCKLFITGFPKDTFLESMRDFAKNVMPSYS